LSRIGRARARPGTQHIDIAYLISFFRFWQGSCKIRKSNRQVRIFDKISTRKRTASDFRFLKRFEATQVRNFSGVRASFLPGISIIKRGEIGVGVNNGTLGSSSSTAECILIVSA
jgi:hypothetical protein